MSSFFFFFCSDATATDHITFLSEFGIHYLSNRKHDMVTGAKMSSVSGEVIGLS